MQPNRDRDFDPTADDQTVDHGQDVDPNTDNAGANDSPERPAR